MGLLYDLFGRPGNSGPLVRTPQIPSILPQVAKDEILAGRLPQINADKLFLTRGEVCHYADQALLIQEIKKRYVQTTSRGRSTPGLLRGNRWHSNSSVSSVEEEIKTIDHKGILYVTNKRIIFTSKEFGFDKRFTYLSSYKAYSNAIELQYGSNLYELFVPDGNLVNIVIKLIQ